jgi:hypothetical protein
MFCSKKPFCQLLTKINIDFGFHCFLLLLLSSASLPVVPTSQSC